MSHPRILDLHWKLRITTAGGRGDGLRKLPSCSFLIFLLVLVSLSSSVFTFQSELTFLPQPLRRNLSQFGLRRPEPYTMGTMEAKAVRPTLLPYPRTEPLTRTQAAKYLIDPLTEPEPHADSGLNTHYTSTFAPKQEQYPTPPQSASPKRDNNPFHPSPKRDNNPFRRSLDEKKDGVNVSSRQYPSPPESSSPRREKFPSVREEALPDYSPRERRSLDQPSSARPSDANTTGTRRRGSSLKERYPGDKSNQPLDIIRRESRRAHRSPHLSKRHMPGADMIDRLDIVGGRYHHEGPYDAALLSRNTNKDSSPLAAVSDSINETLKATPPENISNAVKGHRPLDGTAVVPPGEPDRFGRTFEYKEDGNLMVDHGPAGGGYKQWPGVVCFIFLKFPGPM